MGIADLAVNGSYLARAATLPPWLVTRTSLRSPARARLSPSSVQALIAVGAQYRLCILVAGFN